MTISAAVRYVARMMQLGRIPARIVTTLAVAAAVLGVPAAVEADSASQNATVTMTDTGFSPVTVTIGAGGSVTWKNQGNSAHTATTVGGAPSTFNTAGIGTGQSATLGFAVPGQYYYTSATDCLNNNSNPSFPCAISYLVTVVPPGGAPPPSIAPAPASAAPAVAPAPAGPLAIATVTITDSGMSPATVNVGLNGSGTWLNKGTNVHTATTTVESNTNSVPSFDTGGLGAGQSAGIGFSVPGTYTYFSVPDCFDKSNPAGFNCGPYTVVVDTNPAPSPQGAQAPAPTPTPVYVPGANATVTIDDVKGFQPNQLSVKVGQTVSWLVVGNNPQSVVINQNPTPNALVPWWLPYQLPSVGGVFFDSGGIGPQQTFSYTFNTPGTFPYHSSTEPIYQQNNANCNCTFVTYQFFGTVTVTP
jgi:plastocyanin